MNRALIIGASLLVSGQVIAADYSLMVLGNGSKREIETTTGRVQSDRYLTLGGLVTYSRNILKTDFLFLEIGAGYYTRQVGFGEETYQKYSGIHLPVALHLKVSHFTLGAGLFGFYGMGNIFNKVGDQEETRTFEDSNFDRKDWGPFAALGFHYPLGKKLRLRVEARYLKGQRDVLESDAFKATHEDVQALAGLTILGD